ncbi:hypothetical protein Ancab_033877 [Ancistrocladus abbreviatus]
MRRNNPFNISPPEPHQQEETNGGNKLGRKVSSPNTHPNQPNNHTISPLSIVHLLPHPLLPQLGLPTSPLHKILLPFPLLQMGILSLPQKGLQIWPSSHLLEVQVPLPPAPTADPGRRSGGGAVEQRRDEKVCEEEVFQEEARI